MEREQKRVPEIGGFEVFLSMAVNALRSIERIKTRQMSEFGLSGTHTICMRRLFESPHGLTRTELAAKCGVDRAQITRVIGELISKGCVEEIGSGSHYRKKCVLSEKGRAVTDQINQMVTQIQEQVSGEIPKERLAVFYETLSEICDNLKRAEEGME